MPPFCPSALWNGITHSRLCTVQDVLQFGSLCMAKCWAGTGIFDFTFAITAITLLKSSVDSTRRVHTKQ